jgi:hypothetical protein
MAVGLEGHMSRRSGRGTEDLKPVVTLGNCTD